MVIEVAVVVASVVVYVMLLGRLVEYTIVEVTYAVVGETVVDVSVMEAVRMSVAVESTSTTDVYVKVCVVWAVVSKVVV